MVPHDRRYRYLQRGNLTKMNKTYPATLAGQPATADVTLNVGEEF